MKALILAAGFGQRLLPHTRIIPKPLMPIAGQPLLDITIRRLIEAGCESVMINTHHLSHKIQSFVAQHQYPIPVYIRHEPEILGTGGAIANLSDYWDHKPFLVVNGDVLFNIDLQQLYRFHLSHNCSATLAVCDYPELNRVKISAEGYIVDFCASTAETDETSTVLTFTGIQVLSPEILSYLPKGQYSSSIDGFKSMIAAGKRLVPWTIDTIQWIDIGTPTRYSQASKNMMVQQVLGNSQASDIQYQILEGDGSDRIWTRIKHGNQSYIMADHGIKVSETVSEADSFVAIAELLSSTGVPVPQVIQHDTFSGLVILQDLGDQNLQSMVTMLNIDQEIQSAYCCIIDQLLSMGLNCAKNFDTAAAYQSVYYDRELILEKECRYFVEAFLIPYTGANISFTELLPEFLRLADNIEHNAAAGFIHRDCQSRNIMVYNSGYYFIDFQGGRLGPIQYDLASLLIDPYTALSWETQHKLLNYASSQAAKKYSINPDRFCTGYEYCAISRNLQILGAFGFLSRIKHKSKFEAYIPTALDTLIRLVKPKAAEFPRLDEIANASVEAVSLIRLRKN